MPDRDKVIKGLECCSSMNGYACAECPYSSECVSGEEEYQVGIAHLAGDAFALLKEQGEGIENLKQTAQSMMEGICLLKEQDSVDHALEVLRANGWKEDRMYPEIVRCKDCKYWNKTIYDTPKWLPCMSVQTSRNWFCADGERA